MIARSAQRMRAWAVDADAHRIEPAEKPVPTPARGELLVRVLAVGVCRTDLHVVDGDLPSGAATRRGPS